MCSGKPCGIPYAWLRRPQRSDQCVTAVSRRLKRPNPRRPYAELSNLIPTRWPLVCKRSLGSSKSRGLVHVPAFTPAVREPHTRAEPVKSCQRKRQEETCLTTSSPAVQQQGALFWAVEHIETSLSCRRPGHRLIILSSSPLHCRPLFLVDRQLTCSSSIFSCSILAALTPNWIWIRVRPLHLTDTPTHPQLTRLFKMSMAVPQHRLLNNTQTSVVAEAFLNLDHISTYSYRLGIKHQVLDQIERVAPSPGIRKTHTVIDAQLAILMQILMHQSDTLNPLFAVVDGN